MKIKKFLFIAIIFLVSLVCISAVNAADEVVSDVIVDINDDAVLEESIDDADLQLSEIDEIEQSNDEETTLGALPPAGFGLLDEDINGNDDPVVTLTRNYAYLDEGYDDGVTISRDVTIDGNGYQIDGNERARIFYIPDGVTVVLKNINFINGHYSGNGGAIYASGMVTAENCNFTDNYAGEDGGAIFNGNATDCTFIGNSAGEEGGAIYEGHAINCTFDNNDATENGGAIYEGYAISCIFNKNNAKEGGAIYYGAGLNSTFIQNIAKYGGAIKNGVAINSTFIQNTAEDGGAIVNATAINCNFTQNIAVYTGGAIVNATAENSTFIKNTALISGGAIYKCEAINCNFTQNTVDFETDSGFALDEYSGGAMNYGSATNCNFNGNSAIFGGAFANGNAINCTFTENTASYGGATSEVSAANCTYTQNIGEYGGAMFSKDAINCTFTENTAKYGGAICDCNAYDCNFIENTADWGGAGFYSIATNCTFTENTARYGGAMSGGNATNCTFMLNSATEVGNDAIGIVTENCNFIVPVFTASDFKTVYNSGEKFIFTLGAEDHVLDGVKTIISIYKGSTFVANYSALSGEGWTVNLPAGTYKAILSVAGSDVEPVTKTITVAKNPTAITASAVTATYNVNKYLTIKLTDANGKALSGVKVTVTLGTAKTYTTDKNGQIKINVAKLVPKTYTAKIAYAGNANYIASTKSVKVVVKKASPKMTAKAKSFKVSVKTKKYTITLKNNKGAVMKKVKLTLKVNKKTFKATTNSKGVATFKITNLKKKGKFTATIKYAGSKYYNKLSKKAKITVK